MSVTGFHNMVHRHNAFLNPEQKRSDCHDIVNTGLLSFLICFCFLESLTELVFCT